MEKHDNDVSERRLSSMVYQIFDKMSSGSTLKSEIMLDQKLAVQLHNPVIWKFKKQNLYSSIKGNIWSAYHADICN